MNRTEFIGTNLYYSQEFVDDKNKEIERLNNTIDKAIEYIKDQIRIDKALEYTEEYIRINDGYPDYIEMLNEERNDLLNILEGKNGTMD